MNFEFRNRRLMPGYTAGNETYGVGTLILGADHPGEELALEALLDYLSKAEQRGELGAGIELLLSIFVAESKPAEVERVLSAREVLAAGSADCEVRSDK